MMRTSFKKSIANAVAIMIIAAFLLGFAAVRTTNAELKPAVSIWIDPQAVNITTAAYHMGDKLNVTLWANSYQDASNFATFTWQITINFNASLLSVTRVGYSNGSTSDFFTGHSTVPVSPIITSTSVSTGESLIGTDSRAPGNGSLCWVEMQINQEPTGNATITSTLDIDNSDTFLLTGDLIEITSTKYSAQYNYGSAPADVTPPTITNVARNPATAQVSNGTAVAVNATITDPDGSSDVKNATVYYTINNSTWTPVAMTASGTTWTANIPGQVNGTTVYFKITAFDYAGNNQTKYEPTNAVYYYYVVPEFTLAILVAMMAVLAVAMIAYRKKLIRLP
jgi:hypothetical protein